MLSNFLPTALYYHSVDTGTCNSHYSRIHLTICLSNPGQPVTNCLPTFDCCSSKFSSIYLLTNDAVDLICQAAAFIAMDVSVFDEIHLFWDHIKDILLHKGTFPMQYQEGGAAVLAILIACHGYWVWRFSWMANRSFFQCCQFWQSSPYSWNYLFNAYLYFKKTDIGCVAQCRVWYDYFMKYDCDLIRDTICINWG